PNSEEQFCSSRLNAVLGHEAIEGASRDAESASGTPCHAAAPLERLLDFGLGMLTARHKAILVAVAVLSGMRRSDGHTPAGDLRRQQIHSQPTVLGARHHTPDDEVELSNIAGPWMTVEEVQHSRLDACNCLGLFLRPPRDKTVHVVVEIRASVSER